MTMVKGPEMTKGDSQMNDVVPALLSAGEMVIPKTVVQAGPQAVQNFYTKNLTPDLLTKLYQKGLIKEETLQKFQAGGVVAPRTEAAQAPKTQMAPRSEAAPQAAPTPQAAPPAQAPVEQPKREFSDQEKLEAYRKGYVTPEIMYQKEGRDLQKKAAEMQAYEAGKAAPSGMIPVSPEQQAQEKASSADQVVQDKLQKSMAANDQLLAVVQAGARQGAGLGAEAAAFSKTLTENVGREMDVLEQRRLEEKKIMREKYDQYMMKTEDFIKNATVNPNRVWADKSTGSKILAAVGVALGGRSAADIIQNAINRDIEAQKANIAAQSTAIQMQGDVLSQYRDIFKDDYAADLAAKTFKLQVAQNQLQSMQFQATNSIASRTLALDAAKLGADIQKNQAELAMRASFLAKSQAKGGGGERLPSIAEINMNPILTDAQRNKAVEEIAIYTSKKQIDQNLDKAMDDIIKGMRSVPGTAESNARKAALLMINSGTKELFGGLSKEEMQMVKEAQPGMFSQDERDWQNYFAMWKDKLHSSKEMQTPILDSLGYTPKKIKMERN